MNAAIDPNRLYRMLQGTNLRTKQPTLYDLLYNLIGNVANLKAEAASSGSSSSSSTTIVEQITNLIDLGGGSGEDGSPGPVGPQGPAGSSGSTGSQGPMGPVFFAEDGIDGDPGIPGIAGAVGATGATGATGASGLGLPGPPGEDGVTGDSFILLQPIQGTVNFIENETPGGLVNSSNTLFTTLNAYQSGQLLLYLNGVRQKIAVDYTETSATSFTFVTAPTTGDILLVDYGLPTGFTSLAGPQGIPGPGIIAEDGRDGESYFIASSPSSVGSGGLTQIAQIITSGSQATVDFSGIPASFTNLVVMLSSRDTQAVNTGIIVRVRVNNDNTSGDYTGSAFSGIQNNAPLNSQIAASAGGVFIIGHPGDTYTANVFSAGVVEIINYTSTVMHKRILSHGGYENNAANPLTTLQISARWASTAVINRITFTTDGTAFKDGSVFTLYGI